MPTCGVGASQSFDSPGAIPVELNTPSTDGHILHTCSIPMEFITIISSDNGVKILNGYARKTYMKHQSQAGFTVKYHISLQSFSVLKKMQHYCEES